MKRTSPVPRGHRAAVLSASRAVYLLFGLGLAACLDPIPAGTLQPSTASIEGTVRQRCGQQLVLEGVTITLDGKPRAVTDASGKYHLRDLKLGQRHTLAAELAGYFRTETPITPIAGASLTQNLALPPLIEQPKQLQLDVLFVIDNGPDMQSAQEALVAGFPAMVERLELHSLSLHLGVITADLGAGTAWLPPCIAGGEQARMRPPPLGCSANIREHNYLSSYGDPDGQNRNFDGELTDAFACLALVGVNGCEYGMPLKASRLALDPEINGGFRRPGATLLVVLLTHGDDCSAPDDTELFDQYQTGVGSPLGPLSPYRCFEFGVTCEGASPGRQAGARSECIGTSGALINPSDYYSAEAVLGIIAAPRAPVEVWTDENGFPGLVPTCSRSGRQGTPAIRLATLASLMPQTNLASLCDDFSADLAAWTQQALDLAAQGSQCWPATDGGVDGPPGPE